MHLKKSISSVYFIKKKKLVNFLFDENVLICYKKNFNLAQ